VSVRLTGALVAAFALLAVLPSVAAADLSRGPQRVYDDYRNDAALTPCDHSIKTYRRTLREITPDIEEETPAFRPAVEAALRERESGKQPCAAPGSGEQDQNAQPGASGGSTPASPPASVQPAQPAKPAPAQPAKPAPSATPTPTVAPAAPVTSSSPAPASAPVLLDRPHHGTPVGLLIALGLLALCLLAIPLALLARRLDRFPGARHAWGEAAYRAGGTWSDFLDWARAGR
jgi:hypothetical protein